MGRYPLAGQCHRSLHYDSAGSCSLIRFSPGSSRERVWRSVKILYRDIWFIPPLSGDRAKTRNTADTTPSRVISDIIYLDIWDQLPGSGSRPVKRAISREDRIGGDLCLLVRRGGTRYPWDDLPTRIRSSVGPGTDRNHSRVIL